MPVTLPPAAGPRSIRELYHWVRKWLGTTVITYNTHEADDNAHHNQVHPFYGSDHSGLNTASPAALRDILAFNGVDFSTDRRMNYIFGGHVDGVTYEFDDVVNDNGVLAIAKVQTTDRPEPQPTGPSFLVLDEDDPNWSVEQQSGTSIVTGQRYTATVDLFIDQLRFYIPVVDTDIWYRAAARVFNDPILPDEFLSDWVQGSVVGWHDVDIHPNFVLDGIPFEVFLQSENRANSQIDMVGYDYTSSNGDVVPLAGEMHRRLNRTYVWISQTTASGTLSVPPVAGTQITSAGVDWNVVSVSDQVTYWDCEILAIGNPPDTLDLQFIFQSPAGQSNQIYFENDGYWTANPPNYGTVEGILALDGFPAYNDSGYGVNIRIQQVVVSDDWEFMALPDSIGGSTGGFTPIIFTGAGNGPGYVPDPLGNADKRILHADATWAFQSDNIDGGTPESVYTPAQFIDGGAP